MKLERFDDKTLAILQNIFTSRDIRIFLYPLPIAYKTLQSSAKVLSQKSTVNLQNNSVKLRTKELCVKFAQHSVKFTENLQNLQKFTESSGMYTASVKIIYFLY